MRGRPFDDGDQPVMGYACRGDERFDVAGPSLAGGGVIGWVSAFGSEQVSPVFGDLLGFLAGRLK